MLLVHTTCKTKREAEKIAAALVKEKLAACASVFPCKSFFIWNGKMQRQGEFIIELKTADKNYAKLARRIRQLHSYSLPQIIAVRVSRANADYKKWVEG